MLHYNQEPVRVGYILIPVRVTSVRPVGVDNEDRLGLKNDGELCKAKSSLT